VNYKRSKSYWGILYRQPKVCLVCDLKAKSWHPYGYRRVPWFLLTLQVPPVRRTTTANSLQFEWYRIPHAR